MQRRRLLRGMGLLALAPSLAFATHDDPAWLWREGLAYARWSPSAHNIQPWRLRVASLLEADLYCDPASLLPATDASSAFTMVGLAIFVEYLALSLRPRGYALRAAFELRALSMSSSQPQHVASLRLEPCEPESTTDRDLLLARRTSRQPYDGTPVGEADLQALAGFAAAGGQRMDWSSEGELVRSVLELNRDTLFADLDDEANRKEVQRWIRFTEEEAREKRTGLSSRCLGFPGRTLKSFFDHHQRWTRGWRRDLSGEMLVRSMRGTRTVAWWSGPFTSPEDWIACGTLLARTWLEATRRGLVLHPFGSVITNPRAHEQFRQYTGAEQDGRFIWMLVRLGRSDAAPRSHRLDDGQLLEPIPAVGGLS